MIKDTRFYPVAANEPDRLECLRGLKILNTPIDTAFENVVELARSIFNVPIVLVSLVDENRQWFKARRGLDQCQTAREHAFCNYTIVGRDVLVVEDATQDARFKDNFLVTNSPSIRFYAGVPLDMGNGLIAGSLCIIDRVPRKITDQQIDQLRSLGTLASSVLAQYRVADEMAKQSDELTLNNKLIESQSENLLKQKRILDCASELANIGAWELDCQTGELTWSDWMYRLHEVDEGYKPSLKALEDFYPADTFEHLAKKVAESRETNRPYQFEGQMITAKGNRRWVRVAGHVETKDGVPVRRYGMKQDITDQRRAVDEIRWLAERDPLTGLRNRSQLIKRLSDVDSRRSPIALLLLDLDGFKDINDIYGHAAGDHCLMEMARRFDAIRAPGRMITRVGGDEFAVVVENETEKSAIETLAEKILEISSSPLMYKGASLRFSGSIGIAFRDKGEHFTTSDLLGEADFALYASKAAGRDCFSFFQSDMKLIAMQRTRSIANISQALSEREMELHYQAKVSLLTGQVTGYEALLRWNSKDGIRTPAFFAPALDDPRLSLEIGRFVVQSALNQARTWKDQGVKFGSIAVNVGPNQFRDSSFADELLRGIGDRNLAPSDIEVEVTEDVFLTGSANYVAEVCEKLRGAGVKIALDDFGTGFASLTHLLDFPLSIIKIDRSFIARLSTRAGATGVVKAIIEIGNSLGVDVVAEGVETEAQADFLRCIGCGLAQGYLFHRPLPARAIGSSPRRLAV
ncbi:MAG: sensor domain-containing phosphodiesterase [Hoeflea sp.]|uniref:sensor domain-containing phosphodiesterase n=1 Tax=Hoeflea sp. TaxID=1940281 RepID=UPI003EF979C1